LEAGFFLAAGLRADFALPATSASAGTPSGNTIVMTPLSARLWPIPCAAPRPCRRRWVT
jgi:hypothetical protein